MGPASDRRGQHPEKTPVERLTAEVRWLQDRFQELLKQQQDVLSALSGALVRLDALEEKAECSSFKLDGPLPGCPEDGFDFRGPSRFTE